MYVGDLYLNGGSVRLPSGRVSYVEAARARLVESIDRTIGDPGVPVFDSDEPIAKMAADALADCLSEVGAAPEDIGFLLHCAMWHQGFDIWSAAHYVANEAGASRAIPINLGQGCNGAMAALELLCRSMQADPAMRLGAITAADAMLGPLVDRWNLNYGCVNGDGGSAFLVGRAPAARRSFRIMALGSVAASTLELMHRCGLPATPGPGLNAGGRVSLKAPKKAFLEQVGSETFAKISNDALAEVVDLVSGDAGLVANDARVKAIALPRLSGSVAENYRTELGPRFAGVPMYWWGDRTGHLSCTDIAANVDDLHREAGLLPGDICVLVNAGAGYTWSAAVLEFVA